MVASTQSPSDTRQFASCEEFVLKHGKEYTSQVLTPDEESYVFHAIKSYGRRFPIKQCYYNSQMLLVLGDFEKRMTYVEGYANSIIPLQHGWLEIGGKVIDLTMRLKESVTTRRRLADRVIGTWTDQREYFGVRFKTDYVFKCMAEYQYAGSLVDDWDHGWPVMTQPLEDMIISP